VVGTASSKSGSPRRIPLSFYLVGLLVLFVVTAAMAAILVRTQAEQDAERTAVAEAQFAAELAASEVSAALAQFESTVAVTAANPAIAGVFAPGGPCNVAFGAIGIFEQTHLDFTLPSGSVSCSSGGPTAPGVSYSGAAWLSEALRGAVVAAPVLDPRTGRPSIVVAARAGDRGVVAAFADLTALGTTLATRFAGPHRLEFLVTTPDGTTSLTRSLDSANWSGRPIDGTPFARSGGSRRPDLDNVVRVYGRATAGDRGWVVYAGAERLAAVSTADSLFVRQLIAMSVGSIAFLIGTLFVYRRVIGPIDALSRSIDVTDPLTAHAVSVTGPTEVARLAQNFNDMIGTVKTQLADREHAEARARVMLDASLDAVVGMDQDGCIIEWSQQAETTFGWTRAEAVGRPMAALIVPERYRARHNAGLEAFVRTGVGPILGRRVELEACTRDGREIPVELSITAAQTSTGHVFTAFIRDLTTPRSSEQHKLDLEERLRQSERLEGIGRLAGGIAHDFNNILAVVMNYSQFVEDALPEGSEVRDDVVQIRLAAERGATFTRQLLTFAHRGAVNPQDLQLNSIITELRTMLRRTIPGSVKIELSLAPELWTARIDVGQIEQLLMNLIVNAADAMPDGGTILVRTTNVEFDGTTPTETQMTAGRYVQIEVTDTGHGMSKDVIARAFEPFFTTKARGRGTGLGLATAYGIVQQASGTISIVSAVGKGTTMRVHLPAQIGTAAELARIRVSSVPEAAQSEAVVLVVEDEAAVRKAVLRILSESGYSLMQATGPTSALELANLWNGPIDLLLTDVVMPDLSGDELARELRVARPELRVVYMTGYSGEVDATALRVDGPVVQKPFTRESLLAAIQETLLTTV